MRDFEATSTAGKTGSGTALLLPILAALLLAVSREALGEPEIVKQRLGYGLSDPATGEVLILPKYDELTPLDDGRYRAKLHGRSGILDGHGNILIDFLYHGIEKALPGHLRASVKFENKFRRGYKFGLLDDDGNVVVPLVWDRFEIFPDTGLVKVGAFAEFREAIPVYRWGVIDLKNDTVVPVLYDSVEAPTSEPGKARASIAAKRGQLTEFFEVDAAAPPPKKKASGDKPENPGIEGLERIDRFKEGGRFGFRTLSGNVVAEPRFEDAGDFKEGFARVKAFGKWGFIDRNGRMAIDPFYDYAWDFLDGRAKVRLPDGSVKVIDRNGDLLGD
jgi:hypothetical protein